MDSQLLDYVFGAQSQGATPHERARTSAHQFVRSQDHLALAKPTAKGHRITALEAFEAVGLETLQEVMDYGSAILPASQDEPAATIRARREALGLSVKDLTRATGLPQDRIQDCENSGTSSPIRDLEAVAAVLGLDERLISVVPQAGGDDRLAVRLKTLGSGPQGLSSSIVTVLAEAAWVIRTQARLRQLVGAERRLPRDFAPDDNYGRSDYPAWRHGYYLASRARDILGIAPHAPIESLRSICESVGIPILQSSMPEHLAGATVASMRVRGIVVNTRGYNTNVWVRRATIAHELGHLFWDPERELDRVRVDGYDVVSALDREGVDYVEARANAFAVAFLAPSGAVEREFRKHMDVSTGVRSVMERFGISYTAAKYHIWNATGRAIDRDSLTVEDIEAPDEWRGREGYTDYYFPLRTTSQLRKGDFAGLVVAAQKRGLISADTACLYLQADQDEYEGAAESILEAFPLEGL